VPETDHGIQGAATVATFDAFARRMRDKGYHPIQAYLQAGLTGGRALEIGPGPGYVGLEWLRRCPGAELTGLEISPDMLRLAERNASDYGSADCVRYVPGDCSALPFASDTFDCVFSNGSLHEWTRPDLAFIEIQRVLKPGGAFCVTDLRRDLGVFACCLGLWTAGSPLMCAGFLTSRNAAYTVAEMEQLLVHLPGVSCSVSQGFLHLAVTGRKL
jgi:ubiquinone/menaquinone biosynthesis C-methylase UbiE